jgi:hypothetical protein
LNLRPPGPQPERRGAAQLPQPYFADLTSSQRLWVSLSLIPKLFRERPFGMWVAHTESAARLGVPLSARGQAVASGQAAHRDELMTLDVARLPYPD